MSWLIWFDTTAGAASLIGVILATILGVVLWQIRVATDKLIESTSENTQALIERSIVNTQVLIDRKTTQTHSVLARMEQDANQRQREVIDVIQALKDLQNGS